MLQYTGKLYGKIGRKHIDTGKTGLDWDNMQRALKDALDQLEHVEDCRMLDCGPIPSVLTHEIVSRGRALLANTK